MHIDCYQKSAEIGAAASMGPVHLRSRIRHRFKTEDLPEEEINHEDGP
jgi:hypothetical protein